MIISKCLEILIPALTPVSVKAISRNKTIKPRPMIVISRMTLIFTIVKPTSIKIIPRFRIVITTYSAHTAVCAINVLCDIYVQCRTLGPNPMHARAQHRTQNPNKINRCKYAENMKFNFYIKFILGDNVCN